MRDDEGTAKAKEGNRRNEQIGMRRKASSSLSFFSDVPNELRAFREHIIHSGAS